MAIYNRSNFHKNTYCIFNEVNSSEIPALSHYRSKSGSEYYFTEEGVFRTSNHWGRAAKCKWALIPNGHSTSRIKTGFAKWTAFHEDNDFEKLYFISADESLEKISFCHKDESPDKGCPFLRTAGETTKRIREIRNLSKNLNWLDYYKENERSNILKKVVETLIETDIPLNHIRRNINSNS